MQLPLAQLNSRKDEPSSDRRGRQVDKQGGGGLQVLWAASLQAHITPSPRMKEPQPTASLAVEFPSGKQHSLPFKMELLGNKDY